MPTSRRSHDERPASTVDCGRCRPPAVSKRESPSIPFVLLRVRGTTTTASITTRAYLALRPTWRRGARARTPPKITEFSRSKRSVCKQLLFHIFPIYYNSYIYIAIPKFASEEIHVTAIIIVYRVYIHEYIFL